MNTSETFQTWQEREAFALGFREASVEEWSNARELEFEQRYAELLDSADGEPAAEAAIAWAYDRGAEAGHAQMAAQEIAEADPRNTVTFDATAGVFEAWSPAGEWCGAFDTYAEATRAAEGVADPWGEGIEGFDLPEAR